MIYTFYSFKGGVGRSMALANMAELFYHAGLKVLMVDFDLEAPGLERFFDVPEAVFSPDDIVTHRGLIDMLLSYKEIYSLPSERYSLKDLEESEDLNDSFSSITAEPLIDFCVPIYEKNRDGGILTLMPAGLRNEDNFSSYAECVKSFDWEDFYMNWNGEKFFEWFRNEVEDLADVILIDSRTGITEMGGICTHHLADVVVMFVASNQQNLEGSLKVAKSLSNIDLIEKGRNRRALKILPIPSRIEPFVPEPLDEFAAQFNDNLGAFIPSQIAFDKSYFSELKIPYTPAYSFQERVVIRESNRESAVDLVEAFEKLASTLAKLSSETSRIHDLDFSQSLKKLALRDKISQSSVTRKISEQARPSTKKDTHDRSISISENVLGTEIISGNGNTVYVIQQNSAQQREPVPSGSISQLGPNPYKGLAAFQENDAAFYFGRETQIERLLNRFQTIYLDESHSYPRFLPILGASGCGKSSLARAGFIPELARHSLPGKEGVRVVVLMPGPRPLETLAIVLAKVATGDVSPIKKALEFELALKQTNDKGQYDGLRRIANLIPNIQARPLIILVDQFEEVYSLCKEFNSRHLFIENLLYAASDRTGNVSVVITLRSDFLGEVQSHRVLNQLIGSDQSVIVPAMSEDELRRAIAEPARRAGHPLDEAMINLLIKDTEGREGALPLLQFTLSRIWQGLEEGIEPVIMYQHIGGVGGALAGEAENIYSQLTVEEKEIAQRIFVGLIQLGEGTRDTRRRVPVTSLISSRDNLEVIRNVIRRFSASKVRLLTLSSQGGDDTLEITHESLINQWQRLQQWISTGRDNIRFQRRLEAAARYWQENERPSGMLWRSPDLDLLEIYYRQSGQDMTALQTDFFEASAREKEALEEVVIAKIKAERRLQSFATLTVSLLIILSMSTILLAIALASNIQRNRKPSGTTHIRDYNTEKVVYW